VNIRISFTAVETRMIVLPDAEDRTIVCSFTKHWNVKDGQTDILWLLQRSALRAMRRGPADAL